MRARYWDEAFERARRLAVGRHRRRRVRDRAAALPRATTGARWPSATPTATCRRRSPTSAGRGSASRCSRSVLWGWAAARTIGMRRRDRGLPWDAERVGMAALVAVALVFGVHSAVDWTWFVPANAVCGLIAAAWVVARPSLRSRHGGAALAAAVPAAARSRARDAAPLWAPPAEEPPPAADVAGPGALPVADAGWRRRAAFSWPALAGAVVVLALALTAGVGGDPAGPLGQRRRRRDRAAAAGRPGGRRVDRADRPRPQPALARAAVGARLHRAAARPARQRGGRAAGGRPDPARERGGLAPPRPLPALHAQPARRRARVVPRRVLPRPAQPGVDVRLPRGEPRQRPARRDPAPASP